MSARSEKKSETLEIRLPLGLKTRFMARCQAEGVTASEAVRRFIEDRAGNRTALRGWRVLLAGAAAGLALGAIAAPSIAGVVAPDRAAFDRLDIDGDGTLSFAEFRAR